MTGKQRSPEESLPPRLRPIIDSEGVKRDPMPLEEMTPKERAAYIRMLRKQANNAPRPEQEGEIPIPVEEGLPASIEQTLAMPLRPTLTVMPDFGSGPFLWFNRLADDDKRGWGNCCSHGNACGAHPMSPALLEDFSRWVSEFEGAKSIQRTNRDTLDLDWNDFHARGLALAARLKREVGIAYRVVYLKPFEDADRIRDERREILDDGTVRQLPRSAVLWREPFRRMIRTIVSGGQTGVDRAALDWAIKREKDHAGWVPKGRKAEDGTIDARYHLQETESADYPERTRRNVLDSDATLIVNIGELEGGTLETKRIAEREGKLVFICQLDTADAEDLPRQILDWMRAHPVTTLNVAGPRESKRPGIYEATLRTLDRIDEIGNAEHQSWCVARGLK